MVYKNNTNAHNQKDVIREYIIKENTPQHIHASAINPLKSGTPWRFFIKPFL